MHPYAYWREWIRLNNPNPAYRYYLQFDGGELHVLQTEIFRIPFCYPTPSWKIEIFRVRGKRFIDWKISSVRNYYQDDWIVSIGNRWKTWARRQRILRETRAANTIRNFYYDHVVRVLYNPHTQAKGFLKLLDSDLLTVE